MSTFGDPGFRYHATAGRIGTAMALRLANADVLPHDYVEFARTTAPLLPAIDQSLVERRWSVSAHALTAAIDRMERAAQRYAAARDSALGRDLPAAVSRRESAALLRVERSLTRSEGLRTRPWVRNLIYAADENNGYSNVVFPSVNEAIRGGDSTLTGREIEDLARRFDAASSALDEARSVVSGRR